MYKIIFYTDVNGESDVQEYILNLRNKSNKDSKIKLNKITAYLNQLSKNGLIIGQPYIKHLEDEIWELRPLRDRFLFACLNKSEFLLLNYFMKKTTKTPKREIEKAKKRLKEYLERRDQNE